MKYKVLSAAFVRTVKKPGRYGDGNGLYLLVTPTGARCWKAPSGPLSGPWRYESPDCVTLSRAALTVQETMLIVSV